MDFNRIMKEKLVSESCKTIKAKCGCITLKGVVHHYMYDNGFSNDIVEMTSPYPGKKRAVHDYRSHFIITSIESDSSEVIALKKIYKQELEIRRRQRYLECNKEKIADLLTLWFEHDALMGYFDATERTERRKITRQARQGAISAKEINNKLSTIRKHFDEYREGARLDFTKSLNRALHMAKLQDLELNYGDICQLLGEDVWEQMLDRSCHRVKHLNKEDKRIKIFTDFCDQYNIKKANFDKDATIVTIGFDDIVLAAVLKQKQQIMAVAAIDDVRGRKALRALVGDKQLAEILPKGVYNAVTRQESFYVRGTLYYHELNLPQVITIQ